MTTKKLISISSVVLLMASGCYNPTIDESSIQITEDSVIEDTAPSISSISTTYTANTTGVLDTTDLFTDRDLLQTPDLTDAEYYTLSDNTDIEITEEGIYVLQGSASNVTIVVDADDSDKVQIVLDGVTITNETDAAIYVKNADKVFVTTSADSTLTTTGTLTVDSENDIDAVIYSADDLVLNGTATLTINSSDKGIKSKDSLKVTGGTYNITSTSTAIKAHDDIRIADGTFNLNVGTDGLHAEDSDDDTVGYIYIADGTFNIQSGDDGIHGTTIVQIDGGTFTINAVEAIEATYVQINGGSLNITASDDGINASQKSYSYSVVFEMTGGDVTITMATGDTDGVDSNGNFILSGGTLSINTDGSSLDYDGTGTFTGGTLIVNGNEISDLSQVANMMGGGMMQPGGMQGGGQQGGPQGGGGPGGI